MPAKIKAGREEQYNPNGYADYLENEHYHHSDKGCQIEMDVRVGNRKGEPISFGVVKKCLTHGVLCSKTGWEMGIYLGVNSRIFICVKCGKELTNKGVYCQECLKIVKLENRQKYQVIGRELRRKIRLSRNPYRALIKYT
jgi:hypothetical protein